MYVDLSDAAVEELRKALDNNNKAASDLTSTQFECFTRECRRVVMDSLDIEPGTVVVIGGWEAMRIVERANKAWVGYDSRTYTHEELAQAARSTNDVVRVVHYGVI